MNAVAAKLAADLAAKAREAGAINTPSPQALAEVAHVFGSSSREHVMFEHVKGETFKVVVFGFDLKRGCTLVLRRNESLEHEMSGPVYQIVAVKRIAGLFPVRTLIESSADVVRFCDAVPVTDPFI
jgi:hypothetical protein